jgi:hypothetical protein
MSYERRLTIKSQPAGISLGKEITSALEERGFQEIEQFKKYEF